MADVQLAATQFVDRLDQGGEVFVHHVDDQLRRQVALRAADVVLAKERGHDLCHVFVDTGLREEVLAA